MTEVCNYEILANRVYQDAFQFTTLDLRDTKEEMNNSDRVTSLLFKAFYSTNPNYRALSTKKSLDIN